MAAWLLKRSRHTIRKTMGLLMFPTFFFPVVVVDVVVVGVVVVEASPGVVLRLL